MLVYAHTFSAIQPNAKSIPLWVIAYGGFLLLVLPVRPTDDIPLKNLLPVLVGHAGILADRGGVNLVSFTMPISEHNKGI